ncbi:hypothetical protein BGZ58_006355 [Dissophora ornata]|nr:hypothetical protein BGZ58_006355 [Dissophora ornata]
MGKAEEGEDKEAAGEGKEAAGEDSEEDRRGGGAGRGSGRITDEQKAQIVGKREKTIQIASEGTDDVIVASPAPEGAQHIASYILRKEDFTNFNGQRQIRSFVNSCLLNLSNHHSVDTSGLLSSLASIAGRARLTEIMTMPMYIDAADEKAVLSFQYVILPFIGILTREAVCQSTMTSESGIIYSTVYLHYKRFLEDGVLHCMDKVLDRGSLDDRSSGALRLLREDQTICRVSSLQCALLGIVRLIYQLIKRIQNARIEIADVVRKLHEQQLRCIEVTPDTDENRFISQILVREVTRLQQIVSDAKDTLIEPIDPNVCLDVPVNSKKGRGPNMVHIVHYYDPPGELSPKGPRHDNDAHEISEITLLPTQAEITCTRPPFLPSNGILDAPHFLPPGWRRQLDIHFRLYREDMMDSLRKGVMAFLVALERTTKDKEGNLLKQKELKKHLDDNVSLNVYGGVVFLGMDCKKQSGGSIEISFTQPAQIAGMPHKRRTEFWERSRRRLMQGALVCIARRVEKTEVEIGATTPPFDMVLGVITKRDVEALAKNDSAAHIHISLTDPKLYLMMLNSATQTKDQPQWFLVETMGGFFESYRPILKALQRCVPAALPFGKYLAPTKEEEEARSATGGEADPPFYARAPGFLFDLSVLHKGLRMELNVLDPNSMHRAEELLQLPSHDTNYKPLDSTQAKALVETLCREVAIISGPPGTGKTKIGVDLMRVLLHNRKAMNCGPILCICYTNHALDQFLEHLLDEGIKEIVRVGARSKSEKLEDYNLENLRMSRDRPFSVRQALRAANDESDLVAKEIERLEKALRSGYMDWIYVSPFLMCHNERHWEQFREKIRSHDQDEDGEDETGFQTQKKNNKDDGHPYVQWATGADIKRKVEYNRVALAHKNKEAVVSDNQFSALEVEEEDTNVDSDKGKGKSKGKGKNKVDDNNNVPRQQMPFLQLIPSGDRPLQLLDDDLWHMSLRERMRLIESWKPEVQSSMMQMMADRLVQIEKLAEIKNNAFDDIRRSILRETSVIGMTTNGAAKFQTLISAVAPKIIICEEAGEVLESHILATLSVSTQHLILIGDHLQLRPQIETYELSSDSRIGQNFNLDKSLFERLVTNPKNPLPMSHLTIQRRMRPEISSLIRNTLYPDLEDGERVRQYPPVGGMRANLYFMDHAHPEDSKDQFGMQSYANTFEVKMVEALAHYLIKNGYDQPGDIAVLTPYLGQLSKLRDCLKNSFMLVIDERDQEQLDKNDQDKEQDETLGNVNETVGIKKVALQNHLTLRTIDNYQGEEAKIVIISLVRSNAKENGASLGSSSIGFLKSPNRTNVLLSRAQHGMYLIGNASLMENAKNGLWPTIVDELRRFDRVGDGFPISCKNHPEIENFVNNADAFKIVAPNGGCTATCGRNMRCGHVCPLSCHPDDFEHVMLLSSSLAATSSNDQHVGRLGILRKSFVRSKLPTSYRLANTSIS